MYDSQLIETVSTLEREYKAEVEHSRQLQAGKPSAAFSTSATQAVPAEEAEKDQQSLMLYEELTDLNIIHVNIESTKSGKKVTYNCIQTIDGRSKLLPCRESRADRIRPQF